MDFYLEEEMKKTNRIWIALVALVACICLMYGVLKFRQPAVKEGSKTITIEVKDDEGNTMSYELKTDAEYLVDAMEELSANTEFSYAGEDSDYGLYITTVNGIDAIYEENGAYWAIYVDGDYGQYGADQQPVEDGHVYSFAYEGGQ